MKYFIVIFAALLLCNGCNKKVEEPKLVMPDTTSDPAKVLKKAIENLDKNKMKTHRGTLEAMSNLPGPGPFPPHLLPIKDIRLIKESENSAIYSITSGSGAKAKVTLDRRIDGNDTTWTISPPEEIH